MTGSDNVTNQKSLERKTMLLVLDRSGTGWVHSFPMDVENEKILHTQCEWIWQTGEHFYHHYHCFYIIAVIMILIILSDEHRQSVILPNLLHYY